VASGNEKKKLADCGELEAGQAQKKGKEGKGNRKMKKSKC